MGKNRRRHSHRDEIFRGLYEENKRIEDRTHPVRSRPAARTYVTGIGGVVLLILVFVLATNYVFQDARSSELNTENFPPVTASSDIAEVGLPSDILIPSSELQDVFDFSAIALAPVPLAGLFNLGVRRIVVDAGHGGRDPGALGSNGLMEKDITLDVARRLKLRLTEFHGLQVELTREKDQTLSLKQRADFSNESGADLFVSIHVNQFPTEPVYALETYYFGPQTDDLALHLAELENKNSDYGLAEFNRMIQQIGDRVKLEESRRLAYHIQGSMFRNSRDLNSKVRNWGVKTAPFVVLVGATAPGILCEIGVISNSDEERRLRTPEYREQLAMFLEEGILTYLDELSNLAATQNGVTENATEEKVND
ncbi:MAG: N-acetylmuramoyl-L-alanine amidase [Bacteroidetes bacterium]|nr:MAG: N-acetylmuramoyl-L-alanine amidase [Bacteroidota bacterium]